jgi:hypothetical protein
MIEKKKQQRKTISKSVYFFFRRHHQRLMIIPHRLGRILGPLNASIMLETRKEKRTALVVQGPGLPGPVASNLLSSSSSSLLLLLLYS